MWEIWTAFFIGAVSQVLENVNFKFEQLIPIFYRPTVAEVSPKANDKVSTNLLNNLQKMGYPPIQQGIWIQTQNGELLAQHQPTKPIPAASLTKIATTLVAIDHWGLNHRFVTKFLTNGSIKGNTLEGDLIIQGGGDPLFVWEDAIAIGNKLNQMGIKQIRGKLIIQGKFAMNFEEDSNKVRQFFQEAINSNAWSSEPATQYLTMPAGTPKPNVVFLNQTIPNNLTTQELMSYPSLSLWIILKRMNVYSNNAIADMLAQQLGGGKKIAERSAVLSNVPSDEINLINGSGLKKANQISPRAVVAMLIALQNMIQNQGFTVADFFPIGRCNCGTIVYRELPQGSILKTGTLNDVSALAGVIQTKDKGIIWFAILNQGAGDLAIFHKVQDELVNELQNRWGLANFYRERAWEVSDRP
jgi:D-alanyl-D-alanine carboxypeptidase/D-alanyl-D-alanine-endopeptidase (penicillin-binding protein 4)